MSLMDVRQCRYRRWRKKGTESEDRVGENEERKSLESCRFLDERKGKNRARGRMEGITVDTGRSKEMVKAGICATGTLCAVKPKHESRSQHR